MQTLVSTHCIMIIESDPGIASMLQDVFKEENIPTMVATTKRDALQITQGLQPLLFLINACLSDGDGIELYDQILQRAGRFHIPTVILSTNVNIHRQQLEERNVTCLELPFEIDELTQTVISLLPPQLL